MKKYLYIMRNSFKEQNQSWVSFMSRTLQPVVMVSGYFLLYSYILSQDTQFSLQMYYGYIILVSIIDVPRFTTAIQNDIKTERYTMIDKLPIHPFTYYFFRNIGLSFTTLVTCALIAYATFILSGTTPLFMLLITIAATSSIILSHLLSFTVATIVFYTEQIHMWMFGMLFEFLGGKIIPIVALPHILQNIILWVLPFGFTAGSIAFHIATNNTPSILLSIAIAFLWSLILYIISKKAWNQGSFYFQDHG
jgi:hypothetical protein